MRNTDTSINISQWCKGLLVCNGNKNPWQCSCWTWGRDFRIDCCEFFC